MPEREPHAEAGQTLPEPPLPDTSTILAYYADTWADYRVFWFTRHATSMHFGAWDETTSNHGQSLLNLNRILASQLHIRAGERVLDAGCGVGDSAMWLSSHLEADVVGITIVPDQVARARRSAQRAGLSASVRFEQQTYLQTTFPDASFDVVWAMESVCHTANAYKPRFISEAWRLLRPGGRLGVIEYMRSRRPLPAADEALMQCWCDHWAMSDLATAPEFSTWVQEVGFERIQISDITELIRPSCRRLYRLARVAEPFSHVMHTLRLSSDARYNNKRACIEGYRALERGLWREILLVATRPYEA